jgi:hypothetical protein
LRRDLRTRGSSEPPVDGRAKVSVLLIADDGLNLSSCRQFLAYEKETTPMSDLIDFFERMGSDSESRFVTGLELEEALTRAGIEPSVRSAVLAADQLRLESLIGASPIVCSMINVPDEEEEEEDDEEEEEEGDEDDGAEGK